MDVTGPTLAAEAEQLVTELGWPKSNLRMRAVDRQALVDAITTALICVRQQTWAEASALSSKHCPASDACHGNALAVIFANRCERQATR